MRRQKGQGEAWCPMHHSCPSLQLCTSAGWPTTCVFVTVNEVSRCLARRIPAFYCWFRSNATSLRDGNKGFKTFFSPQSYVNYNRKFFGRCNEGHERETWRITTEFQSTNVKEETTWLNCAKNKKKENQCAHWIQLAQNIHHWRDLVNTLMTTGTV